MSAPQPGRFAWFGAATVWTGAAALSFSGLFDLAQACRVSPWLGWLLPLVIDIGVAVAAWVWRRGVNPAAVLLAGRLTWTLLVLTISGNAAHLGMVAAGLVPPWWTAALVGAVPPAVAGAVAHLLVLLGRPAETREERPAELPAGDVAEEPIEAERAVPLAVPAPPARRTQPDEVRQHRGRRADMVRWAAEQDELPSLKALRARFDPCSESTAKRVRRDVARGAA